jgi:hypothetical protein
MAIPSPLQGIPEVAPYFFRRSTYYKACIFFRHFKTFNKQLDKTDQ